LEDLEVGGYEDECFGIGCDDVKWIVLAHDQALVDLLFLTAGVLSKAKAVLININHEVISQFSASYQITFQLLK
jgi:hypothetical protein